MLKKTQGGDGDDMTTDNFNAKVSEDPISDENLHKFIRSF